MHKCNYKFGGKNGFINLGITCFFIIPFQMHSYYQTNKKMNSIENKLTTIINHNHNKSQP